MSSSPSEPKGRRHFFLAMAAGIGDAVSGAVSAVGARPAAAADAPESTPEGPSAPAPQLRRRNAPPASIPDVRSDD